MKAFLITADEKTIDAVEVANRDDIVSLIGYDTLEAEGVGSDGDMLYFDEECFLRGSAGRFQIDTLIPVSGKGVLVGTDDAGEMADVKTTLDQLESRIKYL